MVGSWLLSLITKSHLEVEGEKLSLLLFLSNKTLLEVEGKKFSPLWSAAPPLDIEFSSS